MNKRDYLKYLREEARSLGLTFAVDGTKRINGVYPFLIKERATGNVVFENVVLDCAWDAINMAHDKLKKDE